MCLTGKSNMKIFFKMVIELLDSDKKKIPKFLKVSQNKSVQKKKNAENWKKLKSLPSGTCIVLSMKKQAEGPKTPENAFPGLMDAKESISGLNSQTSKKS